jgi:hypothetical protein
MMAIGSPGIPSMDVYTPEPTDPYGNPEIDPAFVEGREVTIVDPAMIDPPKVAAVSDRRFDPYLSGSLLKLGYYQPERKAGVWLAYSPDQPRTEEGRFDFANGKAATKGEGKDVTHYVEQLYRGEKVLVPADQVDTLVHELGVRAHEARAAGEQAPNFDLCDVTVEGANLFCSDSFGIERHDMPQLKGEAVPGSQADLEHPGGGEIDASADFRAAVEATGAKVEDDRVPAQILKATRSELNGGKVGGMANAIAAGKTARFSAAASSCRKTTTSSTATTAGPQAWASSTRTAWRTTRS